VDNKIKNNFTSSEILDQRIENIRRRHQKEQEEYISQLREEVNELRRLNGIRNYAATENAKHYTESASNYVDNALEVLTEFEVQYKKDPLKDRTLDFMFIRHDLKAAARSLNATYEELEDYTLGKIIKNLPK
jgi:hypothetical protein